MSVGRYMVDAVLVEGRSPAELAAQHGLSRSWIYQLVARFREGGYAALEPRSRPTPGHSRQVRRQLSRSSSPHRQFATSHFSRSVGAAWISFGSNQIAISRAALSAESLPWTRLRPIVCP